MVTCNSSMMLLFCKVEWQHVSDLPGVSMTLKIGVITQNSGVMDPFFKDHGDFMCSWLKPCGHVACCKWCCFSVAGTHRFFTQERVERRQEVPRLDGRFAESLLLGVSCGISLVNPSRPKQASKSSELRAAIETLLMTMGS